MAMLPQALAMQQAQQGQPAPQQGMPPQQPQQPPPFDPVAELMGEYKRLEQDPPKGPMFTPEQRADRTNRNNDLTQLGIVGQMSGDKGVQNVGGQVFKQALGEGREQRTERGIVDPLSGEETLDPEYVRTQRETRRGQVLQRALAFQQATDVANTRAAASRDVAATRSDAMKEAAQIRADARGAGGAAPNMVQIKDDNTGESYWANPKTGQVIGKVAIPNANPAPGQPTTTPLIRPDKMDGSDSTALTKIIQQKAALGGAIQAVTANPNAFGIKVGAADEAPNSLGGTLARTVRDRALSPEAVSARALLYNNMSTIIKERAGTAQSAQELKRLNGFLPGPLDDAKTINAKLSGFQQYLGEQENGIRSKYSARPTQHLNPQGATPPAAPAANAGWKIEPAP